MYVMVPTLKKFHFCYLQRFIIISGVHGAFSFSLLGVHRTFSGVHAQNIETQYFLLRKP